jgi:hypothetical protein
MDKHRAEFRRFNDVSVVFDAEAVFFGNSFSSKAKPSHLSQHDQAWQTAEIALISTVLWVPVGVCMILVSCLGAACFVLIALTSAAAHAVLPASVLSALALKCKPAPLARHVWLG